AFPAREEAEAAQAVEPFNLRTLEPAGRRHRDMGARRQHLGRMDRGRLVHRDDAEGLVAFGALHSLANETRAFVSGLVTVAPQHGHMEQDVGLAAIRDDEAVALGCVEPLDDAGYFNEFG